GNRQEIALGILNAVKVDADPMPSGAYDHLGEKGIVLYRTRPPSAAVDEYVDRRVGLARCKEIEFLDLGRAVGKPLRRTEPRPHAVAVELVALVHLVAVRRIDRLVIGVVERLLVHVEPDQRA